LTIYYLLVYAQDKMTRPTIDVFITFHQYPEIAELVIESINSARKPRNYRIWGFFDGGFDHGLINIFNKIDSTEKHTIIRPTNYGINWNTPRAFIETAERTSGEYVIQLQSDTVISKDYFEFIDYCMTDTEIGYVLGYAYKSDEERDDRRVIIDCGLGWYGHWGVAVRSSVLQKLYPLYFCDKYHESKDIYAKSLFPDIVCGGSDFYANVFLHKENIKGARPSSSRITNIGILGHHIKLKGESKKHWKQMTYKQRIDTLRKILDNKIYELNPSYKMSENPHILGDYEWISLDIITAKKASGFTATDMKYLGDA